MASKNLKSGSKGKATTVIRVGNAKPARTSLTAAPENLLRVVQAGTSAAFIESVQLAPTQNLNRFANGLTRLEVRRGPFGANQAEVLAAGDKVRSRVCLCTRIVSYPLTLSATRVLNSDEAFQCFSNEDADSTLTLPPARRDAIGLEFFFAVNPAIAGSLKIFRGRDRDVIQIRTAALPTSPGSSPVATVESIKADRTGGNRFRTTVVIACRGVGLWVAENPAITIPPDNNTEPELLWKLGMPVDPT